MNLTTINFENNALTLLQQEEIEEARKDGISEENIACLQKWKLNYLQMRVIRNAMKEEVDPKIISRIARSHVHYKEMESLLKDAKQGEKINLPYFQIEKKWLLACTGTILMGGLLYLYYLDEAHQQMHLTLITHRVEIACGEQFEPENYVKEYTAGQGELILPEAFTPEKPGSYVLSYTLKNKQKEIQDLLYVDVVDRTAPEIKLKASYATILKGASFSCLGYVAEASDSIDGDLSDAVTCDNTLSEEENQKIRYHVKDHHGNEAETYLNVHYVDLSEEKKEEKEPVVTIERKQPAKAPAAVQYETIEVEEYYDAYIYHEETGEKNLLDEHDKIQMD